MASVEIKKVISFEAAHYLHNPKWDRAQNLAVFKRCAGYRMDDPRAEELPHGHSYKVGVTVKGPVDPATGFVMDFRALKAILKAEVHDRYDHRFLNKEVAPFKGGKVQPTAENLAVVIWGKLVAPLKNEKVKLVSVEVWETEDSCATYRGK